MTDLFLKAKHWQLFLLTYGILILFQVGLGAIMFNDFDNNAYTLDFVFKYWKLLFLIPIYLMSILFGWFWSVAIGLQSKVPATVNMKVGKFKILFFIPLLYIAVIMVAVFQVVNSILSYGSMPDLELWAILSAVIVPVHVFAMFCILYSMYFVAKTIKTVELQRQVSFSEFAGEFILTWFFPIGIWIIQPKINKMMEENTNW
jgi:hypothetical protein